MGREIRRVPPNWEHPKREDNGDVYQPMYDKDYETTIDEWVKGYLLWKDGKHPNQKEGYTYWEWEDTPPIQPEYYRPKWSEEPTWYQIYETVSEGTPVTPPFATKEELVDYLVANGDFWDQHRGHGGWKRENAEKFVESGWAPSGLIVVSNGKNIFKMARDGN